MRVGRLAGRDLGRGSAAARRAMHR